MLVEVGIEVKEVELPSEEHPTQVLRQWHSKASEAIFEALAML